MSGTTCIAELDLLKGRGPYAAVTARLQDEKEKGPKPPMRMADDRYTAVDVDDTVFSNELLVDFLVRGIVNAEAINEELRGSRYFVTVADEPPWRTVWHYFERSEEEVTKALARMESQFAAREFTIDGEILHVLGLRLLLSDVGAIRKSRLEVVEDGKKYIDDLCRAKKLRTDPPDTFSEVRAYGGLGMHESASAEYRELFDYLMNARRMAFEDTYAAKAHDILDELKRDVQQFYRRISVYGDGDCARIPVLAKLDPDVFLDALLSLHPSDQHIAMMALKARFEHRTLARELSDEWTWLEKIRDVLLTRAKNMKPMSRKRIESQVDAYIDPVLKDDDSESAADSKEDASG